MSVNAAIEVRGLSKKYGAKSAVDGIDLTGVSKKQEEELRLAGVDNLKRIFRFSNTDHPERILSFMEQKTIWHPIGI